MKQFKYKTSFSSVLHCLVDNEKDKLLSEASLDSLKTIIPKEFQNVSDLLPVAFNACVVNRVNKNDDAIGTDIALSIYKQFTHKPINIEHNRMDIIGHVVNSGLSRFDPAFSMGKGSEIVQEKDVANTTNAFNISLAGVLYRVVGDGLMEEIESSSDPNSPRYMGISASWELGFDSFNIAVGDRSLANCEIITDEKQKNQLKGSLKAFGGSGKLDDGRYVFRVLTGEVVALGIGLTRSPAAEVQGLVMPSDKTEQTKANTEASTAKNVSQIEKTNVKDNSMKTVASIQEIKDIKQEALTEYSVASIAETIEKAIKEADAKWLADMNKEKTATQEALTKATESAAKSAKVEEDLKKVSDELNAIKAEQAKAAQLQKFNERMGHLDETYELADAEKQVIANQIKELDDAKFDAWLKDFEVLAVCKKKSKAAKCPHGNDPATCPECKKAEAPAKKCKANEGEEDPAKKAVENVQPDKTQTSVANASASEPTLLEKYAQAFSIEGIIVKK